MQIRALTACIVVALAGCQSPPEPQEVASPPLNIRTAPDLEEATPLFVSRYVRETRAPSSQLTDILGIPVDVRIPVMSQMSLKDGMTFMLQGSGVTLRTPTSYAESQLYAQSLPLTHTLMGSMTLREALQVIGGQAFTLEEDVVAREVGFRLKEGYVWQAPTQATKTSTSRLVKDKASATESTLAHQDKVTLSPRINKRLADNRQGLEEGSDELFGGQALVSRQGHSSVKSASASSRVTTPTKPKAPAMTFYVQTGESYRDALTRWVHKAQYPHIAFAQEPEFLAALDEVVVEGFAKTGSLSQVIAGLSHETPALKSLTLTLKPSQQLVALHPWRGSAVTALMVQGETLIDAVRSTTLHYQWRWDEARSWQGNNYAFTSYPLVTPKGDISAAMRTLLAPYPLKAQRLDATKTLYIQELPSL
ncbi:hypothetical protein [Vibrio sp. TBV020]|uniref:PFGI-1 class ICE element type IV pilus protein PilL2 n=1 Tax=Vibrio sp. TBV020 TaxID=3137398 RepID=UPI0038CD415F